jgi:hypothetical protein
MSNTLETTQSRHHLEVLFYFIATAWHEREKQSIQDVKQNNTEIV